MDEMAVPSVKMTRTKGNIKVRIFQRRAALDQQDRKIVNYGIVNSSRGVTTAKSKLLSKHWHSEMHNKVQLFL